MKIYSKKGDSGYTVLSSGDKIKKDNPRLCLYGTLDELNSYIGYSRSLIHSDHSLSEELKTIQNLLFVIGFELSEFNPKNNSFLLQEKDVVYLENKIDAMEMRLPKLKNFILPGGSISSSSLHIARTVCRRFERDLVGFSEIDGLRPVLGAFINRLSDYLFVAARFMNVMEQEQETIWESNNVG